MFGVKPHVGKRVQDADFGNLVNKELSKASPGPAALVTPPPKRAMPQTKHGFPELLQPFPVAGNGVVLEIAPHHRLQPFESVRNWIVPALMQLCRNFLQLGCHALADRLSTDLEVAGLAVRPTVMSETEKVKGLRPSL